MGYESTIIIGRRTNTRGAAKGIDWIDPLATLDLSCMPWGGPFMRHIEAIKENQGGKKLVSFFPECARSSVEVTKDCYRKPLTVLDPETVLGILKEEEKTEHYRRLPPAIAVLQAILDEPGFKGENIVVLHYGH